MIGDSTYESAYSLINVGRGARVAAVTRATRARVEEGGGGVDHRVDPDQQAATWASTAAAACTRPTYSGVIGDAGSVGPVTPATAVSAPTPRNHGASRIWAWATKNRRGSSTAC